MAWEDVAGEVLRRSERELLSDGKAREWELALLARRIPHRIERSAQGWRLLVPPRFEDIAVAELVAYEEENRPLPPPPSFPVVGITLPSLWVLLALVAFYAATGPGAGLLGLDQVDWKELGSANARDILNGQVWRLVTALTLHGDEAHLLGNVFIGGVFFVILCREIGSGMGWFLIVLSGVFGNLLNTVVQGPGHDSLGASTAVFGAVGILGGLRVLRGQKIDPGRVLVPVGAGLALLAMLGMGGGRTDIGAHVFGFLCGLVLGGLAGLRLNTSGLPEPRVALVLALVATLIPVLAWCAALFS